MSRNLAILVGLTLVGGAGTLHGVWTHRWQEPTYRAGAVARLQNVPTTIGRWHAQEIELPPKMLAQAGAWGSVIRRYVHEGTGNTLFVSLLCGPAGQMAVHRPEHCYVGTGFYLGGGIIRVPVVLADGSTVEFLTSRFEREDPTGKQELRIFWAWKATDGWRTPDSPRWSLADQQYVYKLYVVREPSRRFERIDDDPAVEFIQAFVPRLSEVLSEP